MLFRSDLGGPAVSDAGNGAGFLSRFRHLPGQAGGTPGMDSPAQLGADALHVPSRQLIGQRVAEGGGVGTDGDGQAGIDVHLRRAGNRTFPRYRIQRDAAAVRIDIRIFDTLDGRVDVEIRLKKIAD